MKNIILSLFTVSLIHSIAFAQSYTEVVWSQIQNSWENASDDGYSMKNYIIGAIKEDEENIWTFYFDANSKYLIRGFCDEDCNDLDLYLFDSDEIEIDSDVEEDDYPIVYFTPTSTGYYKVEISMFTCDADPCYWGLAIFEQ